MNEFKEKTFYMLNDNELDKIINNFYFGGEQVYECVPDNEWNNNSDYAFLGIKGENWDKINTYESGEEFPVVADYQKKDFNRFIMKEYSYIQLWVILTNLALNDIIPDGNYLIRVSW